MQYSLLCEKFPAYVNRETLKRRKSEKIAFDIYIIGFALVNDLEDTRLKAITKPTSRANASQYEESFFNETNGELLETCLELKQTMSVLTAEVRSLTKEVQELKAKLAAAPTPPSTNDTVEVTDQTRDAEAPIDSGGPPGPPSIMETGVGNVSHADAPPRNSNTTASVNDDGPAAVQPGAAQVLTGPDRQATGTINNLPSQNPEHVSSTPPQTAQNNSRTQNEQNSKAPFSLQPNQRSKARQGRSFTGSTCQPISGTATTLTTIKGIDSVKTLKSVYIGRLADTVTTASLHKHFRETGVKNITDIIDLKCRTHGQSSFCIIVDGSEAEESVYNSEIWPVGVKIRPYEEKKTHNSKTVNRRSHYKPNRFSRPNQQPPNPPRSTTVTSAPFTSTNSEPFHAKSFLDASVPPFRPSSTPPSGSNSVSPIPRLMSQPVSTTMLPHPYFPSLQSANRFNVLGDARFTQWVPVM